jgi:hypothetical protein
MNKSFGVGSVLGMSFRVYGRNFIPFTVIAALLYIPMIAWTWTSSIESFADLKHLMLVGALQSLLNCFVSATVTYGVVKELQGQRAGIGACLATGFSRMLPVFGVAILVGIIVGIGSLLLIVPGIIAMCVLYVAMPASVIEKPGIMGALSRSSELTRGYRGSIFGIVLILFVLGYALSRIETSMFPITLETFRTYMYINIGTSIVLSALNAVGVAVCYSQLRTEKDGTSVDDLAKVFE